MTPQQRRVLEALYAFVHRIGWPPLAWELGDELGLAPGTIRYHLTNLERHRLVVSNGEPRAIRITPLGLEALAVWPCRSCGSEVVS